jgi:beta,beta-carotene 9',10'-dioxygenase
MATQTLAESAGSTGAELGFTSLDEETDVRSLPLRGQLPPWLAGTLIRVTPAQLDHADHWFDGLAMLNTFTIGDGGVGYANRFLDSQEYRHQREHGEVGARGFGTDPCRSLFRRVASLFAPGMYDNCNVNVARLGERWIAMTETPMAIEFDPDTLATVGPVEWENGLGEHHTSAHPHHDPERGELVSYVVHFSRTSSYRVFAVPDGSLRRRRIGTVRAREPAYMHSFGLTDRYAILFEQPLVVDPMRMALSDKPFIQSYEWKPERGTRFLVIDREDGSLRATVDADAFFTFHHVNAFEERGELVVDLVGYDDASIIDQLYLDSLRGDRPAASPGTLRRYRLPLDGGEARREQLFDEPLELPRIAYRARNGRPYRYAYAAGTSGPAAFDRLLKVDVTDGSARRWAENGCYPGEPVFVPAPGSDGEDEGVVMSVVLDAAAGRSFLLVLDAGSFEELARAEAPHHVPFGFHGDFAREEAGNVRTPQA